MDNAKLPFASDYMVGACPEILERLASANFDPQPGYGDDAYTAHARELIRNACGCAEAAVWLLSGGTQANAACIGSLLASYEGVIAASTGHIAVHEAGAIELSGHKVIELEGLFGKLDAACIEATWNAYAADETHPHMVKPAMVYLSQPSELGTLYSLRELEAISGVCRENGLLLYVDGARLAYALACPENDVSLEDLARLTDVFYIGATKCGALLGEAVVMRDPALVPNFFTQLKQRGAVLAKGRVLGIQFEALFEDGLYLRLGERGIAASQRLRAAIAEAGLAMPYPSPTNQVFVTLSNEAFEQLSQEVALEKWESVGDGTLVARLVTSWATDDEDVERLAKLLKEIA